MQSNCTKCDDSGMIYERTAQSISGHSCDCGKYHRVMEEKFKDIKIEDLLAYAQSRMKEKNVMAQMLGSITSKKKTKSSRENGKKGGRPKKEKII